jgi:hypothetical protein
MLLKDRQCYLLYRDRKFAPASWSVAEAAILLTSCKPAGLLDPQGPIASAERLLVINSTAIMLVAFAWCSHRSSTGDDQLIDGGDPDQGR